VETFFDNVAKIIEQAQTYVGHIADLTMCITYYEIGRTIIEQEQTTHDHLLHERIDRHLNINPKKVFKKP